MPFFKEEKNSHRVIVILVFVDVLYFILYIANDLKKTTAYEHPCISTWNSILCYIVLYHSVPDCSKGIA